MPGEIAVDRLVIQTVLGLGVNGMGAGPDQRQIALEDNVDELWQLVERSLANEAAYPTRRGSAR
jgi:hypothetical protein